ncbi:basic endochitinase [Quercus suber]|uniref:Basic endochitinase n=1 Tax=Quercus suber TaxID=58331 RepID=A0AAW0JN97_QUESU
MKLFSLILFLAFLLGTSAEQCGSQARGALCPNRRCCSRFGWCGSTSQYCGSGCQSQCSSGGSLQIQLQLNYNYIQLHPYI